MSRVVFMGSKRMGLALFRRLINTVSTPHAIVGLLCPDDRADTRCVLDEFQCAAQEIGIPVHVVSTSRQAHEALVAWAPDIVIICNWYHLLRVDQFEKSRFFGFHASRLPRYRGNAPVVWQIMQGEQEIGLSFFRLTDGMDEGDLVAQAAVPLNHDEGIGEALERITIKAEAMISEHLTSLLDGTAILMPQGNVPASYCAPRIPEDGRIKWEWSAVRIHNFVRAQTRPYPGAFTLLPDGHTVRIWRTVVEPRTFLGVCGGIAERTRDYVVVSCGEGAIRILEASVDAEEKPAPVGAIFSSIRLRLAP